VVTSNSLRHHAAASATVLIMHVSHARQCDKFMSTTVIMHRTFVCRCGGAVNFVGVWALRFQGTKFNVIPAKAVKLTMAIFEMSETSVKP
jgi:hypothetical protein